MEYPETIPILQGRDLDLAVLALIKYLTEVIKILRTFVAYYELIFYITVG